MAKRERGLYEQWNCFIGGRLHRAYVQHNLGANIVWCPRHGILTSVTQRMGVQDNHKKTMTLEQYDRFVKALKSEKRG